jgi:hypothetical protein
MSNDEQVQYLKRIINWFEHIQPETFFLYYIIIMIVLAILFTKLAPRPKLINNGIAALFLLTSAIFGAVIGAMLPEMFISSVPHSSYQMGQMYRLSNVIGGVCGLIIGWTGTYLFCALYLLGAIAYFICYLFSYIFG